MITARLFQRLGLICGVFVLFAGAALATSLVREAGWCGSVPYPNRIECDHTSHLLYVTSPRTGEIVVLDESGIVQSTITSIGRPSAICSDGAGHLFVVDGLVVRKLSTTGSLLMSIGDSIPYFAAPHDVAVSQGGQIFVSDVNDSIKVFDASGAFVRAFGGHGYFAGKLDDAVSLAINDALQELWVADQNNSRIEVFSFSGAFLRTWGSLGTGNYNASKFLRLWGMDRDAGGRLWVFDDVLNAVQVFEPTGAFDTLYTMPDAALMSGVDIAVDGDHAYVTDQSTQCVLSYHLMPTPGAHVTIACSPQGIILNWNTVSGATSYRVQCSNDLNFSVPATESLGTVSDTSFVDDQALNLYDTRFYQVTALVPAPIPFGDPSGSDMNRTPRGGAALDGYHDSPHNVQDGVSCTSCHWASYNYPNPLTDSWTAECLCKSCHVETGMAQAMQDHFSATDTVYCGTCHDPHSQQDQYPHDFLRTAIVTPHSGSRAVMFNNATDFVHGAPHYDGVCEVCHTTTDYYRNNSSGDHTHNAGSDCLTCHPHLDGFRPVSLLRRLGG